MRFIAVLTLLLLLVSCSDLTEAGMNDEEQIIAVLENIRLAFNLSDEAAILAEYHPEFLHNGYSLEEEQQLWDSRLNNYVEMSYSDMSVNFSASNFACVTFILQLLSPDGIDFWQEPSTENGDLSYFYKSGTGWKIYGNQEEFKKED
ncbi:MAG: hypothetical protein JW784_05055 [Candidatus Cloacimonetes bacterium]|nr:hypothetical protein [Candidatus Cloacimonadota bacterium]